MPLKSRPDRSIMVVNLFGGPDSGKHDLARDLQARLARAGIAAAIAPSTTREHARRGDCPFLEDPIAVLAAASHEINAALSADKEVVIATSPTLLSLAYTQPGYHAAFTSLAQEIHGLHPSLNFLMEREGRPPYQPLGRVHSETQALDVDQRIRSMLIFHGISFRLVRNAHAAAQGIVTDTIKALRVRASAAAVLARAALSQQAMPPKATV